MTLFGKSSSRRCSVWELVVLARLDKDTQARSREFEVTIYDEYTQFYGLNLDQPGNGRSVFVSNGALDVGCSEPMPNYILVESRGTCFDPNGRCSEA